MIKQSNFLKLILVSFFLGSLLISCGGKKQNKSSKSTQIPSISASDQTYMTKKQVAEIVDERIMKAEEERREEDEKRELTELRAQLDRVLKSRDESRDKKEGDGKKESGEKEEKEDGKTDFSVSRFNDCDESFRAVKDVVSSGRF